ncbi:hypothetical protein PPH41_33970, partial [Burkholderia gladioli]|nr:hypothetical protein [Burkholderia gladioli]
AEIRVSDCNGEPLASGRTDAQGLLKIDGPLAEHRRCDYETGYRNTFVSATRRTSRLQKKPTTSSTAIRCTVMV